MIVFQTTRPQTENQNVKGHVQWRESPSSLVCQLPQCLSLFFSATPTAASLTPPSPSLDGCRLLPSEGQSCDVCRQPRAAGATVVEDASTAAPPEFHPHLSREVRGGAAKPRRDRAAASSPRRPARGAVRRSLRSRDPAALPAAPHVDAATTGQRGHQASITSRLLLHLLLLIIIIIIHNPCRHQWGQVNRETPAGDSS